MNMWKLKHSADKIKMPDDMKERIIARCEAETKGESNTAGEFENRVDTVEQYRPRVWRKVMAAAAACAVVVGGGGLLLHNISRGNFMGSPEYSASEQASAVPGFELPDYFEDFLSAEGLAFDGVALSDGQRDAVIEAFRSINWLDYVYVYTSLASGEGDSGDLSSSTTYTRYYDADGELLGETELYGVQSDEKWRSCVTDIFNGAEPEGVLYTITNDSVDGYSKMYLSSDMMFLYNESTSELISESIADTDLLDKVVTAVYGELISEVQEEVENNEESAKRGYIGAEAQQVFRAVSGALIDMENDGIDTDTIVSFTVEYGVVTGKNPQMSDELAEQIIEYIMPYYSNITTFAGIGYVSVICYDGEVNKVYAADKDGVVWGVYPDDGNGIGVNIGEIMKEENDGEVTGQSTAPGEPADSEQTEPTTTASEQGEEVAFPMLNDFEPVLIASENTVYAANNEIYMEYLTEKYGADFVAVADFAAAEPISAELSEKVKDIVRRNLIFIGDTPEYVKVDRADKPLYTIIGKCGDDAENVKIDVYSDGVTVNGGYIETPLLEKFDSILS